MAPPWKCALALSVLLSVARRTAGMNANDCAKLDGFPTIQSSGFTIHLDAPMTKLMDARASDNQTYRQRLDGVTAGARTLLRSISTDDSAFEQVLSKVPFRVTAEEDKSIEHGDEFFAYSGVSSRSSSLLFLRRDVI